jgi:hypothetical protein
VVPPDQDIPVDPLDEELAERGRALIAAAVAETRAPLALRERIEPDRARAGQQAGARRSRGLLGKLVPAGGVLAAAVVALVLVLGGSNAPSVLATASLATRGPVLPAPAEDEAHGTLLKTSMQGVPFPYWGGSFRWEAVGARDDKIEDRPAKTVFYDNPKGVRAAYTILGGDKIDAPSGAYEKDMNGVKLFITTDKGRRIVTWTRNGHTCVLSAPVSVPEPKLLQLAAWKGKGGVPF